MKKALHQLNLIETKLLNWTEKNSYCVLRLSIGLIYFLFGILKFFPHYSPAEQMATDTLEKLTFGVFSVNINLWVLAVFETLLGLCLIFNYRLRLAIYLSVAHLMGTFLPFLFLPEQVFNGSATSFSLAGQYIIKNIIIISSLFVLYAKSVKRQSKLIPMNVQDEVKDAPIDQEEHYVFYKEK